MNLLVLKLFNIEASPLELDVFDSLDGEEQGPK